jgi:large subunit ribosomal protein L19
VNKNKYIQTVEISQLRDDIPSFSPGDTVVVDVRVVEGTRERLQPFEGVVLSIKKRGLGSSFIVRKISNGVSLKSSFNTYSV